VKPEVCSKKSLTGPTLLEMYGVLKRNPSRIGAKHGDHFPQANQRRTTISGFEFFGMILRMVLLSPAARRSNM